MTKKLKNLISLLIIISIFIIPLSETKKAHAQASISASGYVDGLLPVILKLPGCKDAIKAGIQDLFGGKVEEAVSTVPVKITDEVQEGIVGALSVPTYDEAANQKLDEQRDLLIKLDIKAESTKKSVGAMDKNDNCMNAIGKAVVKILIQKLTLSIVEWIQTGNSGGPMFVQDPSKFFKDIAKEEILGFGLEINGTGPFAKNFLINQAKLFNQRFADNARYSLNEMIQVTNPEASAVSFNADFSMGGWSAWEALTQVPANNPLGFQIAASNELAVRLEGTIKSPAQLATEALQQAGGFLGDYRCAEPDWVNKEEHYAALNGEEWATKCERWEYVTPGKIVGEKLTTAIGYNDHALLDAETLNDAIAAILDAVMAKFTSKLTNEGIMALNDLEDDSSTQPELGNLFTSATINSGTAFPGSYMTTWLRNNPNFNIHTDITQALLDEQRTYVYKLGLYNDALADLIKWIRQLDYCIPGPNPDWYNTTLENIQNSSGIKEDSPWWASDTAMAISGVLDPSGISGIVGAIENKKRAAKAAAAYLQELLDVNISSDQKQVYDQSGVEAVLNKIFESYRKLIKSTYFTITAESDTYMPGITLEARSEFKKIIGFEQIIEDNIQEITYKQSIIKRLESFKKKVDTGIITPAELDDSSSAAIAEFGRLSAYFITGDDIANIDNLYKQALDEKNYVKNDLLEGPFGCEPFITNLFNTDRPTFSKYARRQPYPYPIDHLYAGWYGTYNIPYPTDTSKLDWHNQGAIVGPNDGFLYGSVYYNSHAGPWSLGNSPGNPCPEYIGIVWLSFPKGSSDKDDESGDFSDIGGLSTTGNSANTCGVITRGFEHVFGVY